MRFSLLLLVAFVAYTSCSVNIIGANNNGDAVASFLSTTTAPAVEDAQLASRMTAEEGFAKNWGLVKHEQPTSFSRSSVDKIVQGTTILEYLGFQDKTTFNSTEVSAILDIVYNDELYSQLLTPEAKQGRDAVSQLEHARTSKQCYCHDMTLDEDSDGEDEESEGRLGIYVILPVGGHHVTQCSFTQGEPGYWDCSYGPQKEGGQVFGNPGHMAHGDSAVCMDYNDVDAYSGLSNTYQTTGITNCYDCCDFAMTMGLGDNNRKFWDSCPKQGQSPCASLNLRQAQDNFQSHLREAEAMKIHAVVTRSEDAASFCSSFTHLPKVRSVEGLLAESTCEQRVEFYRNLGGDAAYMNAYEVAMRACQFDGMCKVEDDLKVFLPELEGEECKSCLVDSVTAGMDLSLLSANGYQTDMFCEMEANVHGYKNEMSKESCNRLVDLFHQYGGDYQTASVAACADVCEYNGMQKYENVNGGPSRHFKLTDVQGDKFPIVF